MVRILFLVFLFISISFKSQNLTFLDERYTWPDNNKIFEAIPDSFKNEDAVILNDDIHLDFYQNSIKRRQAIKILNEQGLNYFKSISLPQNFDITQQNNPYYKQGRFSKRLIPYIYNYKINYFSARIIRNKTITEIPVKVTTNKVYWVQYDGERIYDYEYIVSFEDLLVDDIIEYAYKAEIKGSYDSDQFYVNENFPKLKSSLNIRVIAPAEIKGSHVVLNHNIDSSSYTRIDKPENRYTMQNHSYKFKALSAIKYPQNSLAGKTLPHITANIYSLNRHFFNQTLVSTKYLYSTKYSWFIIPDSIFNKERVYDKYGANLRKFISKFTDNPSDTNHLFFLNQLTDTIHSYKFLSSENMHYSKDAQYSVTSSERLLKRQLVEEFVGNIYSDILFEKNIFYYKANIQDRRLGMHSVEHRAHESYELEFIAIPIKKTFKFYIPRFNGLKYFPDELPFYYEGNLCALFPSNTSASLNKAESQNLKFIKTPISTYNENLRTENAIFKINTDSAIIHATLKENLSGQFSTILRPFYNNEYIDSTITTNYFKKCVDKPYSKNKFIKQTSQSKNFPFKASYTCSEEITISKGEIDLKDWFSFVISKENFHNKITQDYYLDFTFTDTYNFLFEFNKPTSITNINEFTKTLNNEYFDISVTFTKQDDYKYLLTLITKAKQYLIPETKTNYLINYTEELNKINNFKLKFSN